MGRFQKGQPRPKGAGRKPGSPNKITRSVKEAFEVAFRELQQDPRRNLVAWATKNRSNLREFYRIAARFIPLVEITANLPPREPGEVSDLEAARALAFVMEEARRQLQREGRLQPRPAALLPAPPRYVEKPYVPASMGVQTPESEPAAIEGQAKRLVNLGGQLVDERLVGTLEEQGLSRKPPQTRTIMGRQKR